MGNDYIYEAIATFENTTGIPVSIESIRKDTDIILNIKDVTFYGFAKKTGRRTNLGIALPFLDNPSTKNRIILADYLTKKTATYLRENNINYIDGAGNVFIKAEKLFVLTHAENGSKTKASNPTKAFQEAGLKLILLLLSGEEYLNFSYRRLAEMSGISLGSVSNVFDELEKNNFILKTNNKRVLKNKEDLIERWTIAYNDILKPRIVRRKLKATNKDFNLKDILNFNSQSPIYLGGEPGGQLLTNHLIPMNYTIYTNEEISVLGKNLKLIPSENGEIEICTPFWSQEIILKDNRVAPPLVVYADLINSGIHRNLETAKIILDNEL